jgi:hypothetical protein
VLWGKENWISDELRMLCLKISFPLQIRYVPAGNVGRTTEVQLTRSMPQAKVTTRLPEDGEISKLGLIERYTGR